MHLKSNEDALFWLAAIVESSEDAIYGKTLEGIITSWNHGAEKLYGYSAEEVIGRSVSMLAPPGQPDEQPKFLDKIAHGVRIEHFETVRKRKDGKLVDVCLTISPIKDASGEIVGASSIARDVSERKKAVRKLYAASLYSRNLIEASPDPMVTIGPDGKITDVNKATEEVTGVAREHLIGTDFADYFTEREKAREGYQLVFKEGFVRDYPLVIRHISGNVTDVLYNASIYRDENGKVAGVFAAARDITKRKKAEEQLRAASLYARSLIEAGLDPLVTIGPDGKITDVNKATEEVTGVTRDHLIGADFADYFTEPDKAREGYQLVFKEGFVRDYPLAIRHISGRVIDVLYNASVYRDDKGKVIGVFAAARDITERKKAEEQLRAASLYARSLIEASLDPLVTISSEGKITDVNKATEEVTGVERDHLIGADFADYFTEPDKAREGYQLVFKEGFVRDYPLAIRHISGKITDVLYNASVYQDEKGNVRGVFAAARDITERKKAEESIEKLNEDLKRRTAELEASNMELEAFSYSVSHDLRAPLRSVDGFSLALIEDYSEKLDEKGMDYLQRMRVAAQRMGQLIDDLLKLSRTMRAEMHHECINISEIVMDIVNELKDSQPERNVEFIIELDVGAVGDPHLLRIMLENLLGNAWKFTNTQKVARIEFGRHGGNGGTTYFIRDNGVGFDMNFYDKLFNPFQRLHLPNEFPGTGIGLALVKRIVQRHGGNVWAEGEIDKGATIYFTI
jgi:PAS domain S-box-containing protein